jgi:hypothetical protein
MSAANQAWATFVAQLRAERKKAIALGALALCMTAVYVRLFLGSHAAPAEATAAPAAHAVAAAAPQPNPMPSAAPAAATPIAATERDHVDIGRYSRRLSRDLFDADLSNFAPTVEAAAQHAAAATRPSWASEWWGRLGAAMAAQSRRVESSRIEVQGDLAKLHLQGTILGPEPKACINGTIVLEGEIIGGFRVDQIFPRYVTLQKSGCNVRLTMP